MSATATSGNAPSGDGNEDKPYSKQAPVSEVDLGDESTDEDEKEYDSQQLPAKRNAEGEDYSNLERLKKQKRLAMNRASARNRRRQKKEMLESLEKQVEELKRANNGLLSTNETLTTRIGQLEDELGNARNAILLLTAGAQGAAPAPPSTTSTTSGSTATDLLSSLTSLLNASQAPAPAPAATAPTVPSRLPSSDLLSQLASVLGGNVGGGGLLAMALAANTSGQQQTQLPQHLQPAAVQAQDPLSQFGLTSDPQALQNLLSLTLAGALPSPAAAEAPVAVTVSSSQPADITTTGQEGSQSLLDTLARAAGSDPSIVDQLRQALGETAVGQTADSQPPPSAQQEQQPPAQNVEQVDTTAGIVALLANIARNQDAGEGDEAVGDNRDANNSSDEPSGEGTKRPSVDP